MWYISSGSSCEETAVKVIGARNKILKSCMFGTESLSDLERVLRVRFRDRCCCRCRCKYCELKDLCGGEDEGNIFGLSISNWTRRYPWVEAMTCLCGLEWLLGQMIVQGIRHATTLYSSTPLSICAALKKIARTEQTFGLAASSHTGTMPGVSALLRCSRRRKACVRTQG